MDIDKQAALRLEGPETRNDTGTQYGRLVRDQFSKIPVKKVSLSILQCTLILYYEAMGGLPHNISSF